MNLDQTRASQAYAHVSEFKGADERTRSRYGTLALKLPMLIRSAGLCQALHFIHARAEGNPEKPEMRLLGHLAAQLYRVDHTITDAEQLCARARSADMVAYLHLTREAIATAQWYARLSKSVLGVDPEISNG